MRKLFILFSLYPLLSLQSASGQALGDTVLYLLHERGKVGQGKGEMARYYPEEKLERKETSYYYLDQLFDGYPLYFISIKQEVNIRTVSGRQLANLPVVTIKQLTSFFNDNFTKYGKHINGGDYFVRLKKIYIVECVNRRKATVTEVIFNITRE